MSTAAGMPFLEGDAQGKDEEFEEDADLDEEQDEDAQRVEDGEICANCGEEFREYQAEPSMCHDCWKVASEEERKGYVESNSDTV